MVEREAVLLASADGHVGTKTSGYREFLDPGLREEFDHFVQHHRNSWTPESETGLFDRSVRDEIRKSDRYRAGGMESLDDPVRRLKELDADGVVLEILFPDDQNLNTPPWCAGIAPMGFDIEATPRQLLGGATAYNRWLAGFCSAAPDRLHGMITLGSLHDVDAAVKEMRRAYSDGLTTGVFLPLEYYLPLYHHPRYDALWSACSELDLTLTFHAGAGGPAWYGDRRADAIYFAEVMFFARRPLWCFIFGGILERLPNLRLVFTEQGSSWVPGVVAAMDASATSTRMRWVREDPLPMLPSELVRRQCFVANSLMVRSDVEMRNDIGQDVLMWGSDFPHIESMWPDTHQRLYDAFSGVPQSDARQVLGGNLVRAYNLERDPLQALAERIGPSEQDLGLVA